MARRLGRDHRRDQRLRHLQCLALAVAPKSAGRSRRANDLPPLFRRSNAAGAPVGSLLVAAGVASLLVLASSTEGFVQVYVFIALVSTVASLVLYAVCAAAALKLKAMGGATAIAVLGLVYALAMFVGAGLEATLWGLGLAVVGLADPLPVAALQFRFDQPGGGDRSSRASGISRRNFCAKDRRHTSLVPSGPAM